MANLIPDIILKGGQTIAQRIGGLLGGAAKKLEPLTQLATIGTAARPAPQPAPSPSVSAVRLAAGEMPGETRQQQQAVAGLLSGQLTVPQAREVYRGYPIEHIKEREEMAREMAAGLFRPLVTTTTTAEVKPPTTSAPTREFVQTREAVIPPTGTVGLPGAAAPKITGVAGFSMPSSGFTGTPGRSSSTGVFSGVAPGMLSQFFTLPGLLEKARKEQEEELTKAPGVRPMPPKPKPPLVGEAVDIAQLIGAETPMGEGREAKLAPSELVRMSQKEYENRHQDKAAALYEAERQKSALPPRATLTDEAIASTTPDFEGAYNQLRGMLIADKDAVMQKYDIPNRLKEIEDMRARILAEAKAYDDDIREVQNDPDFPKQLKARRLALIESARDVNLRALELQYQFLIDAFNTNFDAAKEELGISREAAETLQARAERQRDDARAQIQQLISTGALGALDDATLQQWSAVSGYDMTSLRTMREAVREGAARDLSVEQRVDAEGKLHIIGADKRTGEIKYDRVVPGMTFKAPTAAQEAPGVFNANEIEKGAIAAGMSIADFQTLSPDVQNVFINDAAAITRVKNNILVQSREKSQEEIIDEILSRPAPLEVKKALIQYTHQVYAQRPTPGPVKGLLQRLPVVGGIFR